MGTVVAMIVLRNGERERADECMTVKQFGVVCHGVFICMHVREKRY